MSTITVSQSSQHWCQYSNINNNRQVNIYIQDRPNQHYCKVQILAGPGVPGGENDNKYFFKATGEYFHTRSVQVESQYVRVSSVYSSIDDIGGNRSRMITTNLWTLFRVRLWCPYISSCLVCCWRHWISPDNCWEGGKV